MNSKKFFCYSGVLVLAAAGMMLFTKNSFQPKAAAATSSDEINFVLSPREGQGANLKVKSTFSAVNVINATTATNTRSMVYMNCTKSGSEYIDLSSIYSTSRLEYLVLDGSTTEHIQPFLIDKDGRTYTFGTTDDTTIAGSAYYETKLDVKTESSNKSPSGWAMNNNTQLSYNYHGFPINKDAHSASESDFVYYHLNMANNKYKSGYTEWASGLGLSPANTGFDFSAVKIAGFWMNKQCSEETSKTWDIKLLEVSVRNTSTGHRTVLFEASKSVVTTSNSTLWNDRVDAEGNSYVYLWNNPSNASSVTVSVGHDFETYTLSQARPLSTLNNGLITITGGNSSSWLWAFAKDYNRFGPMDLTGFDGTVWHINNTTGSVLSFDWYMTLNGNQIMNKMFLFPDDGNDDTITNPVTTNIPAGFKGWVYSLFEQNTNFQNNLASATNESRFVLTTNASNIGKSFEVSSFKMIKNGSALKDAKINAKDYFTSIDKAQYKSEEQATIDSIVSSAKSAIYMSESTSEIETLLANAQADIEGLKTKAAYDVEAFIETLKLDTYDPELHVGEEGEGLCHTYFEDVKTAYEGLDDDAKTYLWNHSSALFDNARERLIAWAKANNYDLDSGSYSSVNAVNIKVNNSNIIVIIASVSSLLFISSICLVAHKKKKNN